MRLLTFCRPSVAGTSGSNFLNFGVLSYLYYGNSANNSGINCFLPKRTLKSKAVRDIDPEKTPPPWPYKEKGYEWFHMTYDFTRKRLNENSKLIVVEGNIGSGKSKLAKELAEKLDFHFIPQRTMDHILITGHGVDRRDYYHLMPHSCRLPDLKMFYENPFDRKNAQMQEHMFFLKYEAHMNALAHILNTGQGVVMERGPWSDFVFVNAMRQKEFLSHEYIRSYWYTRKSVIPKLHFWPHLVIYLDVPVHECLERIKKRGIPEEVNGKVIDYEYLDTIRESYKDYIKEAEYYVFLSCVIEDIENLDLDFYEWHANEKMEEWSVIINAIEWNTWRKLMTQKYEICCLFNDLWRNKYECEELFIPPEDYKQLIAIYKQFVFGPFDVGYNRSRGDSLWKMMMRWQYHDRPATIDKWYEHFWKDAFYFALNTYDTWMDRYGLMYNPLYGGPGH